MMHYSLTDLARHALGVDYVGVNRLSALDHGVPQNRPQGGLSASAGTDDNAPHSLVQGLLQLQHLTDLETGSLCGGGSRQRT